MRLFIGVDLPVQLKQALLEFQSELRLLGVEGSFKSQDNFHITLEFLGEIDESKVSLLTDTIARAAGHYKTFDLTLIGLGAFPSFKRPHTLWTAVDGCLTELNSLREELHRELKSKGFELDDRQFKPHITLASRPRTDFIDFSSISSKKLGEFSVREVVLFDSRALRGKRVYTGLFRAPLK